MPTPLKFFNARASKRICFDNGFVEKDAPMFVAKWNDLLVVARDATNFFVATEAQTTEIVEIIKNAEGEVEYCTDAPSILPQGPRFTWTVQCGRTCQDGCDETILFDRTVETKQEVEFLLEELDGVRYRGPRDFIRVRGPGHYTIKRPKRVAQPTPTPTAEAAQPSRRNQPSVGFTEDRFNYNVPLYWSNTEQPTRNSRQRMEVERLEQMHRREQMNRRTQAPATTPTAVPPAAPAGEGSDSNQTVVMDTVAASPSTETATTPIRNNPFLNELRSAQQDIEWFERELRSRISSSSTDWSVYGEPYSYYDYISEPQEIPTPPPSASPSRHPARRHADTPHSCPTQAV